MEDLPDEIRRVGGPAAAGAGEVVRALDDIERAHILAVLASNGGHQLRTAEQLGIGSATLYRKLKRYGKLGGQTD
jgi:transcriptional regulator of acetoin/glycerol metabolism